MAIEQARNGLKEQSITVCEPTTFSELCEQWKNTQIVKNDRKI